MIERNSRRYVYILLTCKDIEELEEVLQKKKEKAANRIGSQLDKMLERIEKQLIETNSEIGESLCILRPDAEGKITVEELEDALCFIQANPKDERIKILLRNLDTGMRTN